MSLFWRIFLGFWLAMSIIALAVIWFSFDAADRAAVTLHRGPGQLIETARRKLERSGRDGLTEWLAEFERANPAAPRLLVVDKAGNELLDRPVSRMSRRWLERERRERSRFTLRGVDGSVYFVALAPPPVRLGPLRFTSARGPIIGVALLVSALVCFALSRTIARPVQEIDAAAIRLRQGDLRARTRQHGGGAEIVSLGRHFNAMADRVEALLTSQRELLRNVSHELRSPLARLRVALELARGRDDRQADAMQRIERETERLDELIGQVLRLSRVNDTSAELRTESVGVATLLDAIVADTTFEIGDRDLRIDYTNRAGTATVTAEPDLLRSAIENVVRNAMRYSPDDGRITIVLERDDAAIDVLISDNGPGVPGEYLSAIFEPFFRSDAARERATGGDGVGLAITRAVVERLGGQVRAENRSPSGLAVRIRLPLAGTGGGEDSTEPWQGHEGSDG